MRILTVLLLLVFFGAGRPLLAHTPEKLANFEVNCNLPAPANLLITDVTTTTGTGDWDAVAGAGSYFVNVENVASGLIVFSAFTTTTDLTATGLISATDYKFSVQAVDPGGCISPNIETENFSTDFIIIDNEVVFTVAPNADLPATVPLPCEFVVLDAGGLAPEPFIVVINGQNKLQVEHGNNIDGAGCFMPGWQFSNESYTPPANGRQHDAQQVFCYQLEGNDPVCSINFPLGSPDIVISIKRDGNSAYISYEDPNTLKKYTIKYYDPAPGNGHSGDRSQTVANQTANPVISPNPFNAGLSVQFDQSETGPVTLRLLNMNGQTVRSETADASEGQAAMFTGDLAPGIYFLKYETDREAKTYKVIKATN